MSEKEVFIVESSIQHIKIKIGVKVTSFFPKKDFAEAVYALTNIFGARKNLILADFF